MMVSHSCKIRSLSIVTAVIIAITSLELYRLLGFKWPEFSFRLQDGAFKDSCEEGSFILKGMQKCHKWLDCEAVNKDVFITSNILGIGAQKVVKEGFWRGIKVAVNTLMKKDYYPDFSHGMEMLKLFSKSHGSTRNKMVQYIGSCLEIPVILTEAHSYGPASNLDTILKEHFPDRNRLVDRFRLCIDYVEILVMLHTHPLGPRVLCDANDPVKALSQFLITENLTLVLNDVDALPVVDKKQRKLIKCGHRELSGDFVAPEQLWPFNGEFDDHRMPPYDEKVDIWKIPDICGAMIMNAPGVSKLQLRLFNIHSHCKNNDPKKRPPATEVLDVYKSALAYLLKNDILL